MQFLLGGSTVAIWTNSNHHRPRARPYSGIVRARDKRRDRVAKLLQAQRKRRISGIEAQLERWTRHS